MSSVKVGRRAPMFARGEQVWLAVSRESVSEREPKSWWCLPEAARIGDWVLFYEVKRGIRRVEKVTSNPHRAQERCQTLSLFTVETVAFAEVERPISAQDMKESPYLQSMSAVKRSFQGTCFPVPSEYHRALEKVLGLAGLRIAVERNGGGSTSKARATG